MAYKLETVDRLGTDSSKWDGLKGRFGEDGLISMWVADMDFKCPQVAIDALQKRIDHGIFGYNLLAPKYNEAFCKWEKERHGYDVNVDHVTFAAGIVPGINWAVNCFTEEMDAIIIATPCYYPFGLAARNNNRRLISCDMVYDGKTWKLDMERFEQDIVNNGVKLYILSSPHNPSGRVWTEEELDQMLGICEKHGVIVISDEIHQDLIMPGFKHIPSAIVKGGKYAKNIITFAAASKTFNLAGFATSSCIIENDEWRKEWQDYIAFKAVARGNMMGYVAGQACFEGGHEWLDAVLTEVKGNYDYLKEECEKMGFSVCELQGTYLAFVDFSAKYKDEELEEFLQKKCRLAIDFGNWFGLAGKGFARFNLATPRKWVEEAVAAMKANVK
jgi:Bifunctional PLP-dependent enzyme with beta-cystathionase and maltose regulon repressor activities